MFPCIARHHAPHVTRLHALRFSRIWMPELWSHASYLALVLAELGRLEHLTVSLPHPYRRELMCSEL